jgi:hypothetical protein
MKITEYNNVLKGVHAEVRVKITCVLKFLVVCVTYF